MVDIFTASEPEKAAQAASEALRSGSLAVLPTETVYGLAADSTNSDAVAGLYHAKGRPSFNPLIAHVDTLAMAERCAVFDQMARKLAEKFWPGPLTIVLPKSPDCPVAELATAGLDTIAIRMPSHPIMRAVINHLGHPVVAPSANRSGKITATRLEDALADLGASVAVGIDDGPCDLGIESTIVSVAGDTVTLLRPGALAIDEIEAVTGPLLRTGANNIDPKAPGMLTSHYAPNAGVVLMADKADAQTAFIDFGSAHKALQSSASFYADLSPTGDLGKAAACLFETLRAADASGATIIAVAPIPEKGLGIAINDRLRRAAAPRDN